MVRKIVSGGQTGADRGGLDAAEALYLRTGGHAPRGYRTEEGCDASLALLGLSETASGGYKERTVANVNSADATVVFDWAGSSGSAYTAAHCLRARKPLLRLTGKSVAAAERSLRDFVHRYGVTVLNVAGNRESVSPGIREFVRGVVVGALNPHGASYWHCGPVWAIAPYEHQNRVLVMQGSRVLEDTTRDVFHRRYPGAVRTGGPPEPPPAA